MSESEYMIQVKYMNWSRKRGLEEEAFRVIHHIPNSARRNPREGRRYKLMGVVAGIPDVFVPIPNKDYHGLYIEFKTDKGRLSKIQQEVHRVISGNGYKVAVCRSAEEAIDVTEEYIGKAY